MESSHNFQLEIIKPTGTKKYNVQWVEVEGLNGNFIIGPDHSKLVSILKPKGRLIYKTVDNLEVDIDIFGGIIYVDRNKAKVVLDD